VTLELDAVHEGDCRELLARVEDGSVALSVWSPPYFVGKSYERDLSFDEWHALLRDVIAAHARVLKPGGFVAINIADILCFPDETLPRFQADVVSTKRSAVTRAMVLAARAQRPDASRYELAELLGCSEQTIQRRLDHNNVRGGKYATQTRVKTVAGLIEDAGADAGLVLYDRRVWAKDPAWANSRWHSLSYRAVDEVEYVFVLWRPGITKVDRRRLSPEEWRDWGSRGVWQIPSVRANDDHEAKFPLELPRRLIHLLTDPGELVLDPFAGSGTTLVAAVELARSFLGFELVPEYARLAARAVAAAQASAATSRSRSSPLVQ
jgi:site-specific DNA-methyltransferase (adenine-specific)